MPESELIELAHKISDTINERNIYYFIALALIVLATSYISPFIRKTGENAAIHRNLKKMAEQTEKLTETTENVKRLISFADWQEKEHNKIRREKLEQLLLLLYATQDHLTEYLQEKIMNSQPPTHEDSATTISVICTLYFPELREDELRFQNATSQFKQWVLTEMQKITQIKYDIDVAEKNNRDAQDLYGVLQATNEQILADYNKYLGAVLTPMTPLSINAANLMQNLLTTPTGDR